MSEFRSKWRVWFEDDPSEIRVCRDRGKSERVAHPEHLEDVDRGFISWRPHVQGEVVPAISRSGFVAWLDQGGQ